MSFGKAVFSVALKGYWKILPTFLLRLLILSAKSTSRFSLSALLLGLLNPILADGEMLIARMDKSHLSTDTKTYYFSLFYDLERSPSFLGSLLLKNGAECLKSLKAVIMREL